MHDPSMPDSDLSPALGGARAADEPAAAPDATAADGAAAAALGAGPLLSELEGLLGPDGQEVLQALSHLGAFSQELSSFFTSTLQALESQLPQTLAAFEGLVDAVEQVVEQVLEPSADPDNEA
jgi:hypothetical protein